jgi:hypothetical protein
MATADSNTKLRFRSAVLVALCLSLTGIWTNASYLNGYRGGKEKEKTTMVETADQKHNNTSDVVDQEHSSEEEDEGTASTHDTAILLNSRKDVENATTILDHEDHKERMGVNGLENINRTISIEISENRSITIDNNSTTPNEQAQHPEKTWAPSDEWINTCIQEQESNPDLNKPYRVQWFAYNLGDCVRFCEKRCGILSERSSTKHLSIAGQYWEHGCHQNNIKELGNNITVLMQVFQRIENDTISFPQPWAQPEKDELVIHIRLGDVMDKPMYIGKNTSVFDKLKTGVDTRHGPGYVYPNGVKSLHQYLESIRQSGLEKVVLRGGSHVPGSFPKSRVYSMCLAKAIRTAGYNITSIQVDGEDNPDQHFYLMSHAKYFISGTGGYSRLMSELVEKLGGTVVQRPIAIPGSEWAAFKLNRTKCGSR